MMKTSKRILFMLLLAMTVCVACEKAIEDEDQKDNKELYIDDDDETGDPSGNDDEDDKDNTDNGDNDESGDDDDFTEDPTKTDDRETNWDETDIVDGNSDDNSGEGKYTAADTITVTQYINAISVKGAYVKGYIVGCCDRSIKKADFTEPFVSGSNLLLADSPDERNTENVISVELKSGSPIRQYLDLTKHPEMHGRKILVRGATAIYLGIRGIKDVDDFKIYK